MAEIFGLDVTDLGEGYTAIDALVIVKALDDEGRVLLCQRHTEGLRAWDLLGMLECTKADVQVQWEATDE